MITITKSSRGRFCTIEGDLPPETVTVLDDALSMQKKGAQYSSMYKLGRWDGKIHMLVRKEFQNKYIFPAGSLEIVKSIMYLTGCEFEMIYEPDTYDYESNYMDFKWISDKQLYDYQNTTISELQSKNFCGVLELPTGSGKTITALSICMKLQLPTMILVHRSELLYQWRTEIKSILGEEALLIGDTVSAKKVRAEAKREERDKFKSQILDMKNAGVKTKDLPKLKDFTYESDNIQIIESAVDAKQALQSSRICVAMVQTLYSFMKDRKSGFNNISMPVLIVDECHTAPADTVFDVIYRASSKYVIGLTATATRNDGLEKKLFAVIGEKIKCMDVETLVSRGILAEPQFYILYPEPPEFYCSGFTKCSTPNYATVYNECIVEGNNRNEMISVFASKLMHGKYKHQIYIHVNKIAHGEILQSMIPDSVCCFGNTKERRQIVDDFRDGKITCLISTLLKEGVSIPDIDVLIYAAGGKSEVATIQTIGRALRKKSDGRKAIIVDVYDCVYAYLDSQSQQRLKTYEKFYGKLFKPKYIRNVDEIIS